MTNLRELMTLVENNTSNEPSDGLSNLTVDSLDTILEMAISNTLNEDERELLIDSIDYIFNNILAESEEKRFACVRKGCWEGTEDELKDGKCPKCGDDVKLVEGCDEEDDDDLHESNTLKKTTSKQKAKAKKYRSSTAGKKAMKLHAIKRKKFAMQIKRCTKKGQSFSFRSMTCVKTKKRK